MIKYNLIDYQITVGNRVFPVQVNATTIDGQIHIETDSLVKKQTEVAIDLLLKAALFDLDLFNFTLDVIGKKAADLSDLLGTTPSHISQVRRGKTEASKQFWKLFRAIAVALLERRILIETKERHVETVLLSVA